MPGDEHERTSTQNETLAAELQRPRLLDRNDEGVDVRFARQETREHLRLARAVRALDLDDFRRRGVGHAHANGGSDEEHLAVATMHEAHERGRRCREVTQAALECGRSDGLNAGQEGGPGVLRHPLVLAVAHEVVRGDVEHRWRRAVVAPEPDRAVALRKLPIRAAYAAGCVRPPVLVTDLVEHRPRGVDPWKACPRRDANRTVRGIVDNEAETGCENER